jgi:hypothetical protein
MYGVAADTTGVHHQLAFIPKNCHTGIIVMLEKLSYWKNCHTGWRLCSEQGIPGGDLTIWARPSADADGLPGISAHL